MKKAKWAIVGCGWLGSHLLEELIKKFPDVHFVVTKRTLDNCKNPPLGQLKKHCEWLSLDLETCDHNQNETINKINECERIIYLLPPQKIENVKSFFQRISTDKKIIFTSSTSVYGKNSGSVDEDHYQLDLTKTQSPLLVETEMFLRERFPYCTILRLGGLYGKKRHPIYFLQGKTNCLGADELIHLTSHRDSTMAILKVLQNNVWSETFSIVSSLRIKKSDYYTQMAKKLNLTPPSYLAVQSSEEHQNATNISNNKSIHYLGMTYDNPLDYQ